MDLDLKMISRKIRLNVLEMSYRAHIGHVGSCFSMADILAVLYFRILKVDPSDPVNSTRDRFILSKGHAAAGLYAVLAQRGFFPSKDLERYCTNGSRMGGHPEIGCVPGVDATTGALGHGLSLGLGMALGARLREKSWRAFVVLSDGECDEGTVWEAALAAGQFRVDNLVVIVDYNKIQALGRTKEVMDLEPFKEKWEAFGWSAVEVDGHSVSELEDVLTRIPLAKGKPTAIIAHTVMGKGVSFMEDKLEWHYLDPKPEHYEKGRQELERDMD